MLPISDRLGQSWVTVEGMSDADRNAQIVRLLHILRDLDRLGGLSIYELAERHGASVRTIIRDLEALRQAGVPLIEEPDGKKKRWRLGAKDALRKLSGLLDAGHYVALRLAMGQGGAVRGSSSMFAQLEDLALKIEGAVHGVERERLAGIERAFHSWEKFTWKATAPDVLWPLVDAIANRRVCRVKYRAPRVNARETEFDVLPLKLFAHDGATWLLAHNVKHSTTLTLNLLRLRALTVLDQHAEPPSDFDPERIERAAFGVASTGPAIAYRLRFAPEAAQYIRERTWHPSQIIEEIDGGSLLLTFSCAGDAEVYAWICSWHALVDVIEPGWVREDLAELGRGLVERYG